MPSCTNCCVERTAVFKVLWVHYYCGMESASSQSATNTIFWKPDREPTESHLQVDVDTSRSSAKPKNGQYLCQPVWCSVLCCVVLCCAVLSCVVLCCCAVLLFRDRHASDMLSIIHQSCQYQFEIAHNPNPNPNLID